MLTHPSSPGVIEIEEEKVETPAVNHQAPYDPRVHAWVLDFREALVKSFDSELSGEAFIAAVRVAAKIPLNTVRVAGN